jgi:hypothetical protein
MGSAISPQKTCINQFRYFAFALLKVRGEWHGFFFPRADKSVMIG